MINSDLKNFTQYIWSIQRQVQLNTVKMYRTTEIDKVIRKRKYMKKKQDCKIIYSNKLTF